MTNQETNEAVAKKLGWTLVKSDPIRGSRGNYKTLAGVALSDVPDYCGSIQAAWEIFDRIAQDHGVCLRTGFIKRSKHKGVFCDVGNHPAFKNHWVISEYGENAPIAICKAYLKLSKK